MHDIKTVSSQLMEDEITALSEQLTVSYEELTLIYKLSEQLQQRKQFHELFTECSKDLQELIRADSVILFVKPTLKSRATILTAGSSTISDEVAQATGTYILQRCQHTDRPILFTDLSAHPNLVSIFNTITMNVLAWPIVINNQISGVLTVLRRSAEDEFDSADSKLLAIITRHISWFLENRMLINDLEELLMGLLSSLVNIIDAKDPYTRGHSQRVAFIAMKIAQTLELSQNECDKIYLAGLLHDIGKIGINDSILSKPGKLTSMEFETIQKHTVVGAKIISSLKQFQSIIPGVLYHHERYDGSGYPEGLAGDEIPMMGMIVGLADCFDAITSDRTYHKAVEFQEAIEKIRTSGMSLFAPSVVSSLMKYDINKLKDDLSDLPEIKVLIPLTSLFADE